MSIYKALCEAQKEFGHAELDSENPFFNSKYASLKSVIDAVKPILNANGLAFYQRSEPSEGGIGVETVFVHEDGETLSTGLLRVPVTKDDAQGYGSALTYAKRYSLAMACGISADPDDDGNSNSVATDLVEYNACVRECWDSISSIKFGATADDIDGQKIAAESWFELSETEKRILWRAPTNGGIWTTKEREWIKEEARKLHYGENNE